MKKNKGIVHELKHHLPFTLISSISAGVIVAILYIINKGFFTGVISNFFEIMHPAHVFVSAMATAAVYSKYKKSKINAILIGVVGAILIGTLSDVMFPFMAGNVFSLHTHLHLPIFENPFLIIGVSVLGAGIGSIKDFSKQSHSVHVFLSIFASLSYILAFSISVNPLFVILISIITFVAVYVPCCVSDIVFPLLFLKGKNKKCSHCHN